MAASGEADQAVARQIICTEIEHLFDARAREAILVLCRRYVEETAVTPLELLHSATHQRQFLERGTTMTDAVQRAAIPQVKGTQTAVGTRVKTLQNLVDQTYKYIKRQEDDRPVPLPSSAGLGAIVEQAQELPSPFDKTVYVFRALAEDLRQGEATWHGKITRLLGYLPAAATDPHATAETAAPAGLGQVDALLAELLGTRAALRQVVGKTSRLGALLDLLIALYDGNAAEVVPGEGGDEALATALATLLQRHSLPETRRMLARHVETALREPGALTGQRDLHELEAVCATFARMDAHDATLASRTAMAGLEHRAVSLAHPDQLSAFLGDSDDPGQGLMTLLRCYPYMPDEKSSGLLKSFFKQILEDPHWTRRFIPKEMGVTKRLRRIGEVNRALHSAGLGRKLTDDFSEELRRLEYQIVREADLFRRIDGSRGTPADKATALIDLCYAGAFLDEGLRQRATQLIEKYIGQNGFKAAFLKGVTDDGQQQRKLQALKKRLKKIGVDPIVD